VQTKKTSRLTELSNVHNIVLILQNGGFVVVYIQVVRRAENGHNTREAGSPSLSVHAVSGVLRFVGSDD
jgi:hypothetical protein